DPHLRLRASRRLLVHESLIRTVHLERRRDARLIDYLHQENPRPSFYQLCFFRALRHFHPALGIDIDNGERVLVEDGLQFGYSRFFVLVRERLGEARAILWSKRLTPIVEGQIVLSSRERKRLERHCNGLSMMDPLFLRRVTQRKQQENQKTHSQASGRYAHDTLLFPPRRSVSRVGAPTQDATNPNHPVGFQPAATCRSVFLTQTGLDQAHTSRSR